MENKEEEKKTNETMTTLVFVLVVMSLLIPVTRNIMMLQEKQIAVTANKKIMFVNLPY